MSIPRTWWGGGHQFCASGDEEAHSLVKRCFAVLSQEAFYLKDAGQSAFPRPLFLQGGLQFLHSIVQLLCRVTDHLTVHLGQLFYLSPFGLTG